MRTLFSLFIVFYSTVSNAQTGNYLEDLHALRSVIQKMPSYKAQIKGDRLEAYENLYNRLAADTISNPNSYQYFYNLAQLLFPIRDNHVGFYQLADYKKFRTKQSIDSFTATREFLEYPTSQINIDSLRAELSKKHVDSIEGIYHYDSFYRVGLFKNGAHEYLGVVLDSDVSLWRRSQIAIHLYEYAPNLYKAIYNHPLYKNFIFQPIEKYQNHSLVNAYFYASYSQKVYSKQIKQPDYVNLPNSVSKFGLRNINKDVQYLLIQSFQTKKTTALASQAFFDSIKNLLMAPNLILDLRNNEGGAKKEMLTYFKLLKDYSRKGHLYILMNNGTISQAEIFALKLQELNHVTTAGQTTKGMLSYGSNYGKREKLPGGKFEIYPTDMKGKPELLQYEGKGINPEIVLKNDSEWIEQVVQILK